MILHQPYLKFLLVRNAVSSFVDNRVTVDKTQTKRIKNMIMVRTVVSSMPSKIARAFDILTNEGVRKFIMKSKKYLRDTDYIDAVRWRMQRQHTLSVSNKSVKFKSVNSKMVKINRWRHESEYDILADYINEISSGDVIFDIGANTGIYTCFAGVGNPEGEIVAFEPYGPNVDILKQNLSLNSINNVRIITTALSDTKGTVEFEVPEYDIYGYGTGSIEIDDDTTKTVEIDTITGDELIKNDINQPNVIKVDVEGAEGRVLEGLSAGLKNEKCRVVYCEVHENTESDIETLLRDAGFKTSVHTSRGNQYFIKGVKQIEDDE